MSQTNKIGTGIASIVPVRFSAGRIFRDKAVYLHVKRRQKLKTDLA
jgi:hypothetical protein